MTADPFVEQLLQIFGAGARTAAPGSPGTVINPQDFTGDSSLRPDSLIKAWQQDYEKANSHFNFMKTLPQEQRMDYMKNVMISNGVPKEEVEADPNYYAQRFLHEVFNRPGSGREYAFSSSDAALFFGLKPEQGR